VKLSIPVRPTVQTPHIQDELYFVVRGRGVLVHDETIWAKVIVVFGSLSAIRFSQGVAAISCAQAEIAKRNADAVLVSVRICIKAPYYCRSAFYQQGKASTGQAGMPRRSL
jgi:hypothetical protein